MPTTTQNRRRELTETAKKTSSEHWLRAGHYDPCFVIAIEEELDEIAQLQGNWDGYGASAIDPSILAAARQFIRDLPEALAYRPHVVPTSSGGVQFEWHHESKILELEFETPHTIHFLQWHPEASVEVEATFPATDIGRGIDLIQWFMSGTCV